MVVARWFVAIAIALVCNAAAGQTNRPATTVASSPARDAALLRLANALDLPMLEEAVATFSVQLRKTGPRSFLDAVGRDAGLGSAWKPGQPSYDQAARTLENALAAEEARGGPLLKLERSDLLLAVNLPWTLDDIAFIEETRPTELGKQAERAIDAKATEQLIHTLQRRVPPVEGAKIREAFGELEGRAQSQYGDAILMLLPLKATDPPRAARLQKLIESVTVAPNDALGQRVVDRLTQRLVSAASAQLPALLEIVARMQVR